MEDGIARGGAEGAPTEEARSLKFRVHEYVSSHAVDLGEARRWEREEHSFQALRRREAWEHAKRWRDYEAQGLSCDEAKKWAGASFTWEAASADCARMVSMLGAVLSPGARSALYMQGMGAAPPYQEDAAVRDLWARRTIHVYWLLLDPRSKWSGGQYQTGFLLDRASACEMSGSETLAALAEVTLKALDVLGVPKDGGPLTRKEDAVLAYLQGLSPDATGHPGARTGPEICKALCSTDIPEEDRHHLGDDEFRQIAKRLSDRGLIDNKPKVGYWAVRL